MARTPTPKYNIKTMVKKIKEYTDREQLPIIKECCLENEWNYEYTMQLQRENPVLCQAIRRLLCKKEVQLEKALYAGANNTGCVFGLKQLGWKDNPEPLVVNNTIQNNLTGHRSEMLKKVDKDIINELDDLYDEIDKENEENGNV